MASSSWKPLSKLKRVTGIELGDSGFVAPVNEDEEMPLLAAANYDNYRKLVARAADVFRDEIKASRWLSLPSVDFGGETPLAVARKSGYNPETIEPTFIRIEHGINL